MPWWCLVFCNRCRDGVYNFLRCRDGVYNFLRCRDGVYNFLRCRDGVYNFLRCCDGVYNFLRCRDGVYKLENCIPNPPTHKKLKKKVAALEVVAKQLLKDYKTKESEADAMEVERNETREENRKLKRRIEAWLLHGFGSKCCYMVFGSKKVWVGNHPFWGWSVWSIANVRTIKLLCLISQSTPSNIAAAVFPECVARVPVSLWGLGAEGVFARRCVCGRNRP